MWVLVTDDNHGVIHNLVGPFDSEEAAFTHLDRWDEFYADLEHDISWNDPSNNTFCDTYTFFMNHPDEMWS